MEAAVAYRHAQTHGNGEQAFDYRRKVGVEWFAILAPDDVPDWMRDPVSLWRAVDHLESRSNARLAQEIVIGLPHQVGLEEHILMLSRFAKQHCVDPYSLIADVAIHRPPIHHGGDPRHWHAHILLTDRPAGPDGFSRTKDRRTAQRDLVQQFREGWTRIHNERMQELGLPFRIDHRTLERQRADAIARHDAEQAIALNRLPQIRLGKAAHANHPGYPVYRDRVRRNEAILVENSRRIELHQSVLYDALHHQRLRAFEEKARNDHARATWQPPAPTLADLEAVHGRPKPTTLFGHIRAAAFQEKVDRRAMDLSRAHGHPWRDHGKTLAGSPSILDALLSVANDPVPTRRVFTVTAKDIAFALYGFGMITIRDLQTALEQITLEQQQRADNRQGKRDKPPPPPRPKPRPPEFPAPHRARLAHLEIRAAQVAAIAARRHEQEQAFERRYVQRAWARAAPAPHRSLDHERLAARIRSRKPGTASP